MEVKIWKKVALNRDKWAKLLKKVRAHQGLLRDDDDDFALVLSRNILMCIL